MIDFSKYPKELIRSIAEEIDMGMICFLNTDTLEVESVLGESYNAYGDDDFKDFYQEVYDKVDNWVNLIRIEPPQSWQSFKIMEDFIETCISDDDSVKKNIYGMPYLRKSLFRVSNSLLMIVSIGNAGSTSSKPNLKGLFWNSYIVLLV